MRLIRKKEVLFIIFVITESFVEKISSIFAASRRKLAEKQQISTKLKANGRFFFFTNAYLTRRVNIL